MIIGINFLFGINLFNQFNLTILTYQDQFNASIKTDNLFEKALPYDFFGDYSHAKFWEEKTTHKITWSDPDSNDYLFHHMHGGTGHQSFYMFTMAFHKAISTGYKGQYFDQYKDFLFSDNHIISDNGDIEGFWGLEPNWTLLDVSYYLEDWIVWNANEVQNYDFILGSPLLNSDINLAWSNKTINANANQLDKVLIKDYQTVASNLSIGNHTNSLGYVYQFQQQPLNNEAIYDNLNNDWIYQIYPLERLIINNDTSKINAIDKINKNEAHLALKKYDYQSEDEFKTIEINSNQYYLAKKSKLSGFEFLANELIYEWLNRTSQLVNAFGWDYVKANDEILIDPLQTNQNGFVSINDYEVFYEVSDDQKIWKVANTNGDFYWRESGNSNWIIESDSLDLNLNDIDYLKITIEFNDTYRTEASQVSEIFKPKIEWGINNNSNNNSKGWWVLSIVVIILLLIFIIIIFFIKSRIKKSNSLKK